MPPDIGPPQEPRPPTSGPAPGAPGVGPDTGARGPDPDPGPRAGEGAAQPPAPAEARRQESAGTALEDLDAKIAELEDRWLRSAAELDNLRKRMARDADRIRMEERARVAREWLLIVDNLDLALRHAESDPNPVIEGVRAVRDQAVATLARLGYLRNDEEGVPFDPAYHEAVGTVTDTEVAPGTVVAVVRPGYGRGEQQLRPAQVIVSTRPD
ncbi:nucleotide exchange factor GrpE [Sphaerisporangium fuscum]|uniref:nucleotide exchange factor GrpE n=1 Tax=Sphaerisporangium fuscum TaxID=2835868 RepID=UPI001BDC942E|nr:nucleotide exchange factor GrpE [Sphaerisporangium fuscum]